MKATLPSSFPATPTAPFTSVTAGGALSEVSGVIAPETSDKTVGRALAAWAEAGQGALVARRVRRTPADRDRYGRRGPRPVRVVAGRLGRDGSSRGQGGGAVTLDALRVRAVQRQPGEELGRHATAPARVVGRAGGAGAASLRSAQTCEQLRLPPHGGE